MVNPVTPGGVCQGTQLQTWGRRVPHWPEEWSQRCGCRRASQGREGRAALSPVVLVMTLGRLGLRHMERQGMVSG